MTLKEQINKDFIEAFKAKNILKKSALSILKSKITEAEKVHNVELTDADTLKIVISSMKQRKQSILEFTKAGRLDLVEQELEELQYVESYLPKQLTIEETIAAINEYLLRNPDVSNEKRAIGMATGYMNKTYPGKIDNIVLNELIIKEIEKIS